MSNYKQRRLFTKDEIKQVIQLWNSKTVEELANILDRKKSSIQYLAKKIRQAGYHLPKKRIKCQIDSLIKETLQELEK